MYDKILEPMTSKKMPLLTTTYIYEIYEVLFKQYVKAHWVGQVRLTKT